MRIAMQDLRYSFRQLVKMPGFTITAMVSLALGIGATTAVFSVVYAIVVDPYPYANSDRMVHMRLLNPDGSNRGFGLTGGQWERIRQSPVVEDAFLTDGTWALTITGNDVPEDVETDYVSSNTFSFMGVRPTPAATSSRPTPSTARIPRLWLNSVTSSGCGTSTATALSSAKPCTWLIKPIRWLASLPPASPGMIRTSTC